MDVTKGQKPQALEFICSSHSPNNELQSPQKGGKDGVG